MRLERAKRQRAGGDFPARSRFARSTIPEDKWGITRSEAVLGTPHCPPFLRLCVKYMV